MRFDELLAIEILRDARGGSLSSASGLAAVLGIEVLNANVGALRVAGNRIYLSAKMRGAKRERLIAEGIAHWALDRRGDIQTSAHYVADHLVSQLKKPSCALPRVSARGG